MCGGGASRGISAWQPNLTGIPTISPPGGAAISLFSQACGYPFTHEFKDLLKYIATPHYAVPGCQGANYCSFIFARFDQPLDSFRGGIAAVNNPDSMSGMLALKLVFAPFATEGKFFAAGHWKAAATSIP